MASSSGSSGSIEDRIVSIKFDNALFEQKIAETITSLDQLSQKLAGISTGHGFNDIQAAANNVNLSNISNGIDSITGKLGALGAIGFSVIQKLTQNLLGFAGQFVKNDILGPIITGGGTRAKEIAQAQFQFQGLGLNTQEVMQNALDAVKGTAFGLGDAVKAASQFGASGITAGAQMTTSLRAIAGVAAITGTQFNQMSYLFTQGAAKGHIDNQDLMQFATNGFNAAAAYAKANNLTEQSVHDMAAKGKLDYQSFAETMDRTFGKHATDANQTYQGSLDNMRAALGRLGAAFIMPQLNQSRDLFNSMSPVIDTLNAKLQPLMWTLNAARGQALSGIDNFLKNLNFSSLDFAIPNIAQGLQNIFNFLKEIGSIVKTAFKDIFPTSFGATLVIVTAKFEELTSKLTLIGPTAAKVESIFRGVFALLDIGWAIIKGVATVLDDLFHALFPAGKGLLNLADSTGGFLTKLDQVLVKGGLIQDFFARLGAILAVPVKWITELAAKIAGFLTLGGHDVISGILDKVGGRLNVVSQQAGQVTSVWDRFKESLQGVFQVLDKVYQGISDWFHQLFHKIAQSMQPADFNSALDAVNVGLLGGITLMLKKFFEGGIKFGFGGGVFNNIKNALNNVTRSFQLMQTELKAQALEKIAIAIAIVAASVLLLSTINSADLTKALGAMVFGFGELAATLLALDKVTSSIGGAAKLDLVAGSLIALAAAMVIFSFAIKELSKIPLGELAKGLGGVAAGMAILVTGVNAISTDTGGLVRAGIAMGIIAVALRILADAVKAFSRLSWAEMGKGLVGVGAGLAAITLALNFMPPESLLGGLGFIALAIGLRILADAVKAFGNMNMTQFAKGLGGVIVALAGIALAMNFMPADLPITAIGVGILAVALGVMAEVIKTLGSIPFGQLAKGIGAMAITLGILAIAVNAMDASVTGAASLAIVAGSLLILTKVIEQLGKIPIAQLAIGIGAIAAVLLVLGLAAAALTPVLPEMLLLGIALGVIGGAFALFGAGAFLAVSALELFAVTGLKSIAVFTQALPALAAAGVALIINFANDLLIGIPTLVKTIRALLDQLLETVVKESPKIGKALEAVIETTVKLLQKDFPLLVKTGAMMLDKLLQGIQDNIGTVVDKAAGIIVNFCNALSDNMDQVVGAGANVIISFLNELGNHVDDIVVAGYGLLVSILKGMITGEADVIAEAAKLVISLITELGNHTVDIVAAAANLVVNIITGIAGGEEQIITAATNLVISFINELGNHTIDIISAGVNLVLKIMFGIAAQAVKLVDAAGQCILSFLDGLDKAIKKYEPQIISKCIQIGVDIIAGIFFGVVNAPGIKDISGWFFDLGSKVVGWVKDIGHWVSQIGDKIVHGIWDGITGATSWLGDKLSGFGHTVLNFIGAPFGIHFSEPTESTVMRQMALQVVRGFVAGITNAVPLAKHSMSDLAQHIVNSFNPDTKAISSVFDDLVSQLGDMAEFNPKITPVLDLSKVQAGAGDISGLLGAGSITATVSTDQAAIISAGVSSGTSAATDQVAAGPSTVIFNQTNNSPEALSTNDIYRNTKSQITLAKEELGIS